MTPEYLEELAQRADPDELWRISPLDQMDLPPEKRKQLDTGVALRRAATHQRNLDAAREQGMSLVITPLAPNGVAQSMAKPMIDWHIKLLKENSYG